MQLVFLPGYPVAVGLMYLLVRDYLLAAFLVSALCFSGAGCLLYSLFRLDYGHAAAIRAVRFLCVLPGSFFFAAPMSEGLFLLCCAGCVYLVRRGKFGLGCLVGAYGAFTRSLGLMLFVPAVFELVSAWLRVGKKRGFLPRFLWALLIPTGFGVYCYINYRVAGDPFQYMRYQNEHWGQDFGLFFNTAAYQLEDAIAYFQEGRTSVWGLWVPNPRLELLCTCDHDPCREKAPPRLYGLVYRLLLHRHWCNLAAERPRYLIAMPVVTLALSLVTDSPRREFTAWALCLPLSLLYLMAFTLGLQVW